MTVEATKAPDHFDVTYRDLSAKPNHPASVLASATEDNELRNVSLKSVVASKYTLLNETLLEAFGVAETRLQGKSILEEEKNISEYQAWLEKLQTEVSELKSAKEEWAIQNDKISLTLAKLNAEVEESIKYIPDGTKVVPKVGTPFKVLKNTFKSKTVAYERASTAERKEQVAVLSSHDIEIPDVLPGAVEELVPPVIGVVSDTPELAIIGDTIGESGVAIPEDVSQAHLPESEQPPSSSA